MATVAELGELHNTTNSPAGRTVTATPSLNDLIVVVHANSGFVVGDSDVITDNNADGNGTYTAIGASNPIARGGGTGGALWISVRNSLIGSATSTVFTETDTGLTGGGLTVLRVSGMTRTGASAVLQSVGEDTQTESPVVITFPSATNTNNPIILGCMGEDNPAALGPPTGFTETTDTGWGTPTSGIHVCFVNSGQTASVYTYTSGAFTDHCEAGIELDTSAVAADNPFPFFGGGYYPTEG